MTSRKLSFLIRNKCFPKNEEFLSQSEYDELSSEKQKDYVYSDCEGYAYYYKKSYYETISHEQIEEMAIYEIGEKINSIDKNINTIKKCILFSLIMSILSLIIYACVVIAL